MRTSRPRRLADQTATHHVLAVTVSDGELSDTASVTINVADVDPFADAVGSVFAGDIEWLAFSGITQRCNPPVNDEFCPNDLVTRGQMAAFLHRALGQPTGSCCSHQPRLPAGKALRLHWGVD